MGEKKKQNSYTKEFKEEVLGMIEQQGRSVPSVCKDLGLNENTVYTWMQKKKEHGSNAFVGTGNLRPEAAELKKYKQRIKDLEEEVEILKKATAFFAKLQK